jgi:hypothetical protein
VIEVESQGATTPRRVIVERLSNLPPRPSNVIIEKWLPYRPQKRRVVYQRANAAQQHAQRNTIIEWEAPEVEIVQQCKDLGVVDMDPEEYCRRHGNTLLQSHELPTCDGNRLPAPAPIQPQHPRPVPIQQTVPVVQSSSFCCRSRPSTPQSPPARQQHVIAVQQQTVINSSRTNVITTPANNNNNSACAVHCGGQTRSRRGSQSSFDLPELEGEIEALRKFNPPPKKE